MLPVSLVGDGLPHIIEVADAPSSTAGIQLCANPRLRRQLLVGYAGYRQAPARATTVLPPDGLCREPVLSANLWVDGVILRVVHLRIQQAVLPW